jgi:hypothetical protein
MLAFYFGNPPTVGLRGRSVHPRWKVSTSGDRHQDEAIIFFWGYKVSIVE